MTEAKSAQPQLPPRPEREHMSQFATAMFSFDYVKYAEFKRYADALETENESLKAQLDERNNRGTGYLYVPKAQYNALKTERDKMMEVVREYREFHDGCCKLKDSQRDTRCYACIKADVIPPKEKE